MNNLEGEKRKKIEFTEKLLLCPLFQAKVKNYNKSLPFIPYLREIKNIFSSCYLCYFPLTQGGKISLIKNIKIQ